MAPWLERALQYGDGRHTAEDVLARQQAGQCAFWVGEASIIVTEFIHYPRGVDLNWWLIAGDPSKPKAALKEIVSFEPGITAFARACGCQNIVGAGREGWARVTERLGWEKTMTVCGKRL